MSLNSTGLKFDIFDFANTDLSHDYWLPWFHYYVPINNIFIFALVLHRKPGICDKFLYVKFKFPQECVGHLIKAFYSVRTLGLFFNFQMYPF